MLSAAAWTVMLQPHAHHRLGAFTLWMLMTLAMMLPMVITPLRTTAERSLWRRRHRAMAGFLLGYLAPWIVIGIAISSIDIPYRFAPAIAFAVAGAWQLTRFHGKALMSCHRSMPLAPRGWRADRDCVRYGWWIGTRCVASCWALMLACVLSEHALVAMIGLTSVGLIERYARKPDQRLLSAGLFAAAFASFMVGG